MERRRRADKQIACSLRQAGMVSSVEENCRNLTDSKSSSRLTGLPCHRSKPGRCPVPRTRRSPYITPLRIIRVRRLE